MDYRSLANELLGIRAGMLQIPANRKLSELVKGEYFVLNYLLTRKHAVYPSELSQQLVVSTARIAALLNHMEEKGLIARTADAEDNRHIIVNLTSKGTDTIRKKRKEVADVVAQTLEQLGEDDALEYLRIQKKLIQIYSRHS